MARSRSYDMTFEINGKVASSFNNVFNKATTNLNDLKKRSREAQREMARLGREFRNGKIHQSQYAEGTAKLARELKQLEGSQRRLNALKSTFDSGMNKAKRAAGVAVGGTAVAATTVALSSLNKAADFEAQMAKAGAKTEATRMEMAALNKEALRLGANSSLSASQVAVAMDELGAKGFDANKIIAAIPGLIAATEASSEDLALVSNVVTSAINAYGLEAKEASRVADVMAMSANKTAAGVADLGFSFKYAAPVANTLGIQLEELAASTGILVDKGLAGEQAGTALRMALIRLSKPPTEAKKALKALNITAIDSKGKFKSLTQLSQDWEKATAKLSETQKVQYAATIFGTEASTAMLSLFGSGPAKINEMTKSLENSSGAAAKAAAVMKDNYAGAKEQMFSALESAQIAIATPTLNVFKDTFQGLTAMIDDGMPKIESLGEKIAWGLRDILEPFATLKPKLTPEIRHDPEAFKEYEKALAKFQHFDGMDLGDKVIYMLDTATAKAEEWLGGSGGQAMEKIFSKLGEIAVKAFFGAFTGSLKAAGGNALNGNFAGALGMGAVTWMLGGGALVKGAIGAGRWALEKRGGKGARKDSASSQDTSSVETASTKAKGKKSKAKRTKGAAQAATATLCEVTTAPTSSKEKKSKTKGTNKGAAKVAPKARQASALSQIFNKGKNAVKGGGKALTTVAKGIGKGFAPIGLAMGVHDIFKSKDKVKTTAQTAGGFAGGLGGAKLGAAIGTAIAPGIGTTLGLLLGGAAGYIGGKWAGGKAVDTARGGQRAASHAPSDKGRTEVTKSVDTTKLNAAATQLATTFETTHTAFTKLETSISTTTANMDNLTKYTGQGSTEFVTSFASLKVTTDLSNTNMSTLASTIGQATGWVSSIQGIQPAVHHVIVALNRLRTRIDNMQIQGAGGAISRRTQYE
ncbi:phage tail tape measure protein [Lysinibacillus sp. CD3-6]|uniref:phage tail tape measure protein n=1 Tax=Lysinibacillus sp. CD3-6 TaxID=2892541 RepID=UPI0011669A64|nr:phage tail tape measure protein [Lysinibacillus sp. CD3-6]UED78364.1 phage tail tape measure protein [Lysinibacillus sp. CD3-6]